MKTKSMRVSMIVAAWLLCSYSADCQHDTCTILFYNVENLYDPFNDTLKMDDDFLPTEPRAWNYGKFRKKVMNLGRALVAAGQWRTPALIGLCEVENRFVLRKLVEDSPLRARGYRIIHHEGPDARGVDVALLYDPLQVEMLQHFPLSMLNPVDSFFKTRDILYARCRIFSRDTLHVFVNHWPSKYGGIASSLEKRRYVASRLRDCIDTLFRSNSQARILITGDFNDEPEQEVVALSLGAGRVQQAVQPGRLWNLMHGARGMPGTHKFRGEWSVLDQFIVSSSLLSGYCRVSGDGAIIRSEPFMLEEDASYSGYKPFRTFAGPRYLGGYSDHLPIRLDLVSEEKKE